MEPVAGKAGTGVYVVDNEYRIAYFNEVLEHFYPDLQLGSPCYRELCGRTAPCPGCPLGATLGDKTLFFNRLIQTWVEVEAADIEWPGLGACHLLLCHEIDQNDKSLPFKLAGSAGYDELFELNLTANVYRSLYHIEGKHATSERTGVLDSMLEDVGRRMIHPDDLVAFNEFWNLDTLRARFADAAAKDANGGMLRDRFRRKQAEGGWRWIQQLVVPLPCSPGEDELALCFIQDIEGELWDDPALFMRFAPSPIDPMTGLLTRVSFFSAAAELLAAHPDQPYCLMAIDVEHFKLFNQWHGEQAGDSLLKEIAGLLSQAERDYGAVAGYLLGDDFCIAMPDRPALVEELQGKITDCVRRVSKEMAFLPSFGLYAVVDPALPVSTMYDRALVALDSVKGNYAQFTGWYEEDMMEKMEEDHTLLLEVQRALSEGEFVFYAQPKCNIATGKIVGLESLARWMHPERGVIPPARFMPVLERNGLVTALDLHIWEQVCRALRSWIDAGRTAVPISVNVSRRDVYAVDVVDALKGLVAKYRIDPKLLSVEITESAYVEDYQIISRLVDELRAAGFAVHMDDFGSGYSSLNMLKDLNVDVLKLDMKLLDVEGSQARKGKSILESIITMARLVDLRVIAEGVETEEQRDFLMRAGCLYAQGYYFYRPMPPEEFEPIIANPANVDYRGLQADRIEQLQLRQLLSDSVLSDAMMDDILGAIAFYDVHDGEVELVSANQQYCRLTGINPIDLEERRHRITRLVYEDDWLDFLEAFEEAYRKAPAGAKVDMRRLKPDGSTVHIHLRVFYLRKRDGHRFYYGSLADVTEQVRQARQLESSQRALSAVVGVSNADRAFMSLAEENRRTASAIFAQMSPGGMIGGYCEDGFPLYFANAAMVELLGYESYDELAEAIDWHVGNTIHPDDLAAVQEDIGPEYYPGLEYTTTYRMPKKDGTWFWTLDKGKVVEAEDGRLAIVSACTDISEVMAAQQQLAERNELLLGQNRELAFLNEDMPGGYHRCADAPGFEFLYVSDRFVEMFGYSRKELKEVFDDKFQNMVHPDDRDAVAAGVAAMREGRADDAEQLEYRMKSKHRGYLWVVDQSRYLRYEGVSFLQGVVVDVTETVELRNAMRMLVDHTLNDIVLVSWTDRAHARFEVIADGISRKCGYAGDALARMLEQRLCTEDSRTGRRMFDEVAGSIEAGADSTFVVEAAHPAVPSIWIRCEVRRVEGWGKGRCGEEGRGYQALCLITDVTALKKREQELWLARRKLEGVLRLAGINSWEWDLGKNRLVVMDNELSRRSFGRIGRRHGGCLVFDGPFNEEAGCSCIPEEHREEFFAFFDRIEAAGDHELLESEIPFILDDGSVVWFETKCETVRDSQGELVEAVGYYADVTDRVDARCKSEADSEAIESLREQRLKLVKMAETDALTGLYNRQTAIPRIEDRLRARGCGHQGEPCALIMLDMDRFKQANDVFGHAYGDEVIATMSAALKASFPQDIVCRMGGDEFMVWCEHASVRTLEETLEKTLAAMEIQRISGGREFLFSVSAGYVLAPQDGMTFDELYQKADAALFAAKMRGRRSFARFEESMSGVRYELAEEGGLA